MSHHDFSASGRSKSQLRLPVLHPKHSEEAKEVVEVMHRLKLHLLIAGVKSNGTSKVEFFIWVDILSFSLPDLGTIIFQDVRQKCVCVCMCVCLLQMRQLLLTTFPKMHQVLYPGSCRKLERKGSSQKSCHPWVSTVPFPSSLYTCCLDTWTRVRGEENTDVIFAWHTVSEKLKVISTYIYKYCRLESFINKQRRTMRI